MTTLCSCPGSRTTIRFDAGVVLQRCLHCDAQRWTLSGRPVPAEVAHHTLAETFATHRKRPAPAAA